jgi:hypothetical protein
MKETRGMFYMKIGQFVESPEGRDGLRSQLELEFLFAAVN